MFYGLSPMKCLELAFEYAQRIFYNQLHNLPQCILSKGTTYPTPGACCATFFSRKLYFLYAGHLQIAYMLHHILKYMYIFYLKELLSWPRFKVTLTKNWHDSPHSPLS